ncbi:MAG: ATP-binding cassette domain-containing protein [Bacillota bacterium]
MLKIENLTFEYIKNTKVLKDLNCGIKEGLNIVFSKRGEGKTTLLDLFLFPKKNQTFITLHEKAITKQIAKEEFSAIQSDWFLNGKKTVSANFENSKYKNLICESFLENTIVNTKQSEKVENLSLQEKFQLAILRALRKNPSVLILDSPFHSVAESEKTQLLQVLENITEQCNANFEKKLCVLLLSRPFNVQNRTVSLLCGGRIQQTDSYKNIQNTPKTTLIAIEFAKYKNNVVSKENQNYYINGDLVKIGKTHSGVVTQIANNSMTVDFDGNEIDIAITEGYKIGDKITVDIPNDAVSKLDE